MKKKNYLRKYGFTLAEVLVTLGVVGVVAAMTLPTLISKYKEQVVVNQLSKVYSELSQAYNNYYSQNNTVPTADDLINNLKTVKKCEHTYLGCADMEYKFPGGSSETRFGKNDVSLNIIKYAVLNNGVIIRYTDETYDRACNKNYGSSVLSEVCEALVLDINGNKEPNQRGRDVFYFYITSKGVYPFGMEGDTNKPFSTHCNWLRYAQRGEACAAWVLHKKNMDYLHCKNLNWTSKTKCE